MSMQCGPWIPFNAERIETLPETGAVFEIATLVRNVLYIGPANGNLRQAATQLLGIPGRLPLPSGGLYIRFALTGDEPPVLAERLRDFQQLHAGALPQANDRPLRPLRAVTRVPQAA